MSIVKSNESGSTKSLADVRQEYAEARAAREQQLEGLRQELAEVQRGAIAATTANDRRAAAAVGSRLQVLTASVAAVEAELHSMARHLAEAEVLWGQQRAVAIEAALPGLENAAREARNKVKGVEAQARESVAAVLKIVGDADGAVSRARSELEQCGRTIGNAKVQLARLSPAPASPGVNALPLSARMARFIAREASMVDGCLVSAGSEVLIPGPEAVQFNVSAARHSPDQPAQLRSMAVAPAPDDQALVFLRWEAAPPKREAPPLDIPVAGPKPAVRVPPPRRVKVLSALSIGGVSHEAGEVLDLDAATAVALQGNVFVEAVK